MKFLRVAIAVTGWCLGLYLAFALSFALSPRDCAPDPFCGDEPVRWGRRLAILALAIGPGLLTTFVLWKTRRRAG